MGTRVLVSVLAIVGVLTGCTGDDDAGDEGPTTTAPATTTDPAWSPPGTAVVAGLVVPDGAALVGAPVAIPVTYTIDGVPTQDPDVRRAVLAVTGDPFAVFDALADQARALDADLPGSAGSCLWNVPLDPEAGIQREPVAGPDPGVEVTGVRCEATAGLGPASLRVALDVDAARPPTVLVELREEVGGDDEVAVPTRYGAAEQTRANRRNELGDTPEARADEPASFLTADEPVPADAADRLPPLATEVADGAPGDTVVTSAHCRSDPGAGDLVVPDRARVVARPYEEGAFSATGDAAVLVTDDVEAALQDLFEQAAGPGGADGAGGFFGEPPAPVDLDDGSTAWAVTFGTSAGGDLCELVASADGTTILMTVGRG